MRLDIDHSVEPHCASDNQSLSDDDSSPQNYILQVPDAHAPAADLASQKKKKKRKPKKSAKAKVDALNLQAKNTNASDVDGKPPVLCISRNKHWRYISSYHASHLSRCNGTRSDMRLIV